jgi:uncharacterized protein (DUF983 family)
MASSSNGIDRLPRSPVMLGRALFLRCPRCGQRGLFVSWFALKERCPNCELRLQRGEAHDYWIGGMMFNIVLSEFLAVLTVGIVLLATWPDVPWNAVWSGAIALMFAAPFLLFPVSRIMWLAFDLTFRPHHESHYR